MLGETECPADEAEAAAAEAALALDPNNAALQLRVAAWKRNGKAFSMLTLALPNKLFRIIASAGGLAKEVMRQLCAEYMPTDRISHVEAQRCYDAIRLDQYTHPRFLHQAFAQICAEFPLAAADDSRLMAIIFNIAPTMYQSVLATEQLIRPNCTADTLITAMEILFRQQHTVQDIRANRIGDSEVILSQVGLRNGEENDNSDNNNNNNDNDNVNDDDNDNNDNNNRNYNNNNQNYNNNNRYNRPGGNIICAECGGYHDRSRCWCLPENALRRPPWWRFPAGYQPQSSNNGRGQELGHVNLDGGRYADGFELML